MIVSLVLILTLVLEFIPGYGKVKAATEPTGQEVSENTAFTKEEISKIKKSNVPVEDNYEFKIKEADDEVITTEDSVFLLSLKSISNSKYGFCSDYKYLEDNSNRIAEATPYAASKGASSWWLRTLGGAEGNCACYVDEKGNVNTYGEKLANKNIGIRPVIMISLK